MRVQDPFGFVVEYFHDIEWIGHHHQRYDLRHGASINRLDHINLVTDDVRALYEWYTSLGFGLSETIEDDDGTLYATWMFRKQTVHDIASTQGSSPQLHHFAFACPESHHILNVADTLGAANEYHHIERGPGRHGVSNAFYLYLRDPDGHRVEIYTTDYFTGDPGHQPLRWSVNDQRRPRLLGQPDRAEVVRGGQPSARPRRQPPAAPPAQERRAAHHRRRRRPRRHSMISAELALELAQAARVGRREVKSIDPVTVDHPDLEHRRRRTPCSRHGSTCRSPTERRWSAARSD